MEHPADESDGGTIAVAFERLGGNPIAVAERNEWNPPSIGQ
jgi:hypothetical protein